MDELLALLRSNDIARYEREKAKFFGVTGRYTTGNAAEQMSVSFSTFPRSGNSMMRKYFENVTGIATGEEMGLKHTPHISLQFSGLKGADVFDSRTWIKKNHFPFTFPFANES